MAVNILLADDHRMVREGLKQLLETDSEINVVAEAGDGYECLNLTNKTKPDIVLLDINMPNMDGIQVLNIMKQQKMLCKVIVLTIHNEIEYLVKALEIGCDGFILKDSDFDTLKKAIFSVYSGETYIEPSLMPLLNSSLAERDVLKEKNADLKRQLTEQKKKNEALGKKLRTVEQENQKIRASWSFRIGKVLVWLPGKIKRLFRKQ